MTVVGGSDVSDGDCNHIGGSCGGSDDDKCGIIGSGDNDDIDDIDDSGGGSYDNIGDDCSNSDNDSSNNINDSGDNNVGGDGSMAMVVG